MGAIHRWTRGVERGHPPLVAEISTPLELKYTPPPPFLSLGKFFLMVMCRIIPMA